MSVVIVLVLWFLWEPVMTIEVSSFNAMNPDSLFYPSTYRSELVAWKAIGFALTAGIPLFFIWNTKEGDE